MHHPTFSVSFYPVDVFLLVCVLISVLGQLPSLFCQVSQAPPSWTLSTISEYVYHPHRPLFVMIFTVIYDLDPLAIFRMIYFRVGPACRFPLIWSLWWKVFLAGFCLYLTARQTHRHSNESSQFGWVFKFGQYFLQYRAIDIINGKWHLSQFSVIVLSNQAV